MMNTSHLVDNLGLYLTILEPINIFLGKHKNDNEPIRLSYQRGSHYNSIVDPYKATIGVGLGLPSYTPGLAENNLMKEAVSQSEHFHMEQVCTSIDCFNVVISVLRVGQNLTSDCGGTSVHS
jgi:hypothetical protein